MRMRFKGLLAGLAVVVISSAVFLQYRQAGAFGDVAGLTTDHVGNIYTVDWWHKRVQKYDSNGKFLWAWGTEATDVVVDKNGNVYGIEGWTERITRYTSFGLQVKEWGATRSGDSEYFIPSSIALDSKEDIYIADNRDSIKKYTRDGVFLAQWGEEQREGGNGTLKDVSNIAIDSEDNIYAFSTSPPQIHKFRAFDPSSQFECSERNVLASGICFVTKWNASGIRAMAIDSQGYLYSASHGGIKKYSNNGTLVKDFGPIRTEWNTYTTPNFGDIVIGKDGYVYVSETWCGWILKYSSEGELIAHWGAATNLGGISTSGGRLACK
jgi:hypothetical protein